MEYGLLPNPPPKKKKNTRKNTALLRVNTHPTVAGPAGLNIMSGIK